MLLRHSFSKSQKMFDQQPLFGVASRDVGLKAGLWLA
jgi:hypothetical protein